MIPYLETRNYVKGVLAFSWVYGQLLGKDDPFLAHAERGPQFDRDVASAIQSNAITSSALKGQLSSRPSAASTGMCTP